MTFDYGTEYEVGSTSLEVVISYTYTAGNPATHEEPEDPPEIDITGVMYKLSYMTEYATLDPNQVLYTLICNDDNLALEIMDNHEDERPGDDV